MSGDRSDPLQGTLGPLTHETRSSEPMHGRGVAQGIERMSKGVFEVSQGSLYPAGQRVKRRGWTRSEWRTTGNDRRAKRCTPTSAGERRLANEGERRERAFGRARPHLSGVLGLAFTAAWLGVPSSAHGQQPEVVGAGVISTDGRHETFPAIDPVDGSLWFSVYAEDFGQQTIMRAEVAGDGWAAPEVVGFSGRWGDRAPRFSPDGSRLYFTSDRPVPGDEAPGGSHIWRMDRRADGGWGPPRPAPGVDVNASDIHSAVTATGAMYVASTRAGGFGRFDLYRVGPDGSVLHLPAPLNDEYALTDVWVSADERWMILVITNHPGGLGGDDLYVSRATDGGWSAPRNLGAPINSDEYEYGPSVSPDGRYLYFTSHRRGSADIFRIPLRALGRDVPP